MSTRRMTVGVVLAALAVCGSVVGGQAAPTRVVRQVAPITPDPAARAGDSTAAVRQFLQTFYDWYAPFVQTEPRFPAWWQILTKDADDLDADLASALRVDSAARVAHPVTREVIDSDPFLHSQDPCPRYKVTDIRHAGRSYRATVEPVCPNAEWQHWQTLDPPPVVEVIPEAGHWKIANVFYGNVKFDLKSEICLSAKADVRPERRPAKCPM